jgi:hypothetical protein
MKDEYAVVPIQNFKTNIAAIRKRICVNQARAARDHTVAVYNGIVLRNRRTDALNAAAAGTAPQPVQRWPGSQAQTRLLQLMEQNEHVEKKPAPG